MAIGAEKSPLDDFRMAHRDTGSASYRAGRDRWMAPETCLVSDLKTNGRSGKEVERHPGEAQTKREDVGVAHASVAGRATNAGVGRAFEIVNGRCVAPCADAVERSYACREEKVAHDDERRRDEVKVRRSQPVEVEAPPEKLLLDSIERLFREACAPGRPGLRASASFAFALATPVIACLFPLRCLRQLPISLP